MRKRLILVTAWLLMSAAGQAMAGGGPSSRDTSRLEEGERIYQQYCASCHGSEGEGQPNWERQNAQGELPAPPHRPEGHTWKHSDDMLYRIIAEGWRDPWNKTERLTMPAFEDVLTPAEIRSVINFLKSLWTSEQRHHQAEESVGAPFPTQSE